MPRVLLTRILPRPCLDFLEQQVQLEINQKDETMSRKELIKKVRDKDGLICLLTDNIDEEIINTGAKLKIIANYAVGYNNIDVREATKRKIPVTNTPGVLTETTADLTFALILAAARRVVEADRFLREGKFKGWAPMLFLGNDVYGKTLGIIGLGRIGRAVAHRAKGFNMKIIYHEPKRLTKEIEKEHCAEYREFEALLKEADFITIHVPLMKTTHHLITKRELSMMKKTAYLVNVSRGSIIDEKDLVRALKEEKIAGCALDVFEREPEIENELKKMKNAVLVPHIGSASVETRTKMAMTVAENVVSVLIDRKKPSNVINPEIYQ